jgi:hypothetical protein
VHVAHLSTPVPSAAQRTCGPSETAPGPPKSAPARRQLNGGQDRKRRTVRPRTEHIRP